MTKILQKKYKFLSDYLKSLESVVVAFSGGVDSSLLLKVCKDVLKDKVLAVIGVSETYPKRETNFALKMCKELEVKYLTINTKELNNLNFKNNPENRCYFCKTELFSKLQEIAKKEKFKYVLDGANYSDLQDFRPGSIAAQEQKVVSPLKEAKLTKEEIRQISKKLKLPTWNKPSFACLSSRFPYNTEISLENLKKLEQAEDYLYSLGFNQFRVRYHQDLVRIEVDKNEIKKFLNESFTKRIVAKFKKIGFTYITLDLQGYRTGSMNEKMFKKNWR